MSGANLNFGLGIGEGAQEESAVRETIKRLASGIDVCRMKFGK
jgi:hypothetical protein